MPRILSWNVERLKAGATRVVEEIINHRPNIVALQEFQLGSNGIDVKRLLAQQQYKLLSEDRDYKGFITAVYSNVIGTHDSTPGELSTGTQWWSEAKFEHFGLSAVHIPTPGHALRKQFWNVLVAHAITKSHQPHAIVGDFNTTREKIDNEGKMVAGKEYLAKLAELGWIDAWRNLHPTERGFTWFSSAGNGFRLDQMWVSPMLASLLQSCWVHDGTRVEKYSDHAMLIVDLADP